MLERLRGVARERDVGVGDGDDAASGIAAIAGQVRGLRPCAGAEHADANLSRSHRIRQPVIDRRSNGAASACVG